MACQHFSRKFVDKHKNLWYYFGMTRKELAKRRRHIRALVNSGKSKLEVAVLLNVSVSLVEKACAKKGAAHEQVD